MLVEQYRMNQVIMAWSSQQMYENRLVAHGSVRNHVINDLLEESKDQTTELDCANPLLFIDTAGALMYEAVEEDQRVTESKLNLGEVDLVLQVVQELIDTGV
jgi:superfamily I DNA and/or RNA helicase